MPDAWPDAMLDIPVPAAQRLEETLAAVLPDAVRGGPAVFVAPAFETQLPDGLPGVVASAPEPATFDPGVVLTTVPGDGVGVAYGDTFRLHSNPASTYKVYLDFDGHTTSNTQWNSYWGVGSFESAAFTIDGSAAFNATELTRIQQVWQRVAEYFAPFNIDVTTEDPGIAGLTRSGSGDNTFGIRVVVTDEMRSGYGGIAWVGSFDWSTGEAAFVYANNLGPDSARYIADAAAHEAGHALGLSHDGQTLGGTTADYYYGHGSGVTDWAPVMGAGYEANIVQWSRGQYLGATQTQDDLAVITTQNSGLGYAADTAGGTIATAAVLAGTTAGGVTTVATWGVISGSGANNDVDMFRLDVGAGGSVNLAIGSWTRVFVGAGTTALYDQSSFTMLDVSARLFNASGGLVATSDDPARLDAAIAVTGLAAGSYYLAIDGVGWGDPLAATPTGYSEYGSLGQYMIRGSFSTGTAPAGRLQVDRAALTTTEAGGTASLRIFLANADATTPDSITVQIAGLDATEGALPAGSLVLTRATGWSASIVLAGVDDRDDDADRAYSLDVSAGAFGAASVAVTNLDDDIAAASAGARAGTYKKLPTASGATLAALGSDDGVAMTLTEGTSGGVSRLEWRWQFTGLAAGDKRIQLDAASPNEAMRFEYSNNGTTWSSLDGSGLARTAWNGDYVVTATGSSLWIRVVDAVATGDTRRDVVSIDLLTLENVAPAPGDPWFA